MTNFSFFLDASSIGQYRAKVCTQLLQELNPDVNGDFIDENVDAIIKDNPEFFKSFNVVVTSGIGEKSTIALSNLLWEQNVPLIVCNSVGFIASARLQIKEHCIIESHPDNKQSDLRLEEPFKELEDYIHVGEWIFHLYVF